jgi:hypothetical protein
MPYSSGRRALRRHRRSSGGRSWSPSLTWNRRTPPSRRSSSRVRAPAVTGDGALRPVPAHLGRVPAAPRAGPSFDPARPVIAAFTRQPFDIAEPQPLLTEPVTRTRRRAVQPRIRDAAVAADQVLHPHGRDQRTTRCAHRERIHPDGRRARAARADANPAAAGPGHPGRTAGPAFEMYYQLGNFIPSRGAAWAVMSERAAMLAARCADAASHNGALASIGPVAETTAAVAARLASHVPPALRPT